MNRKLMLALLLAGLVAATGAFASGNKEDKAAQQGPGFYGPGPYGCPGRLALGGAAGAVTAAVTVPGCTAGGGTRTTG
jgi:hypothetical protein